MPRDVPARLVEYARAVGVSLPAARVLWNRGYQDEAAATRFLLPMIEHLKDPFGLRDMDRAAERLLRAVRERERILLRFGLARHVRRGPVFGVERAGAGYGRRRGRGGGR